MTWTAVLLATLVLAAGGAFTYWRSALNAGSSTDDQVFHSIEWRAKLYVRKATGGVPELTWSELWHMTRVRGGFGLGEMIKDGQGLEGSVVNPYVTDTDLAAGAVLFKSRCAGCHAEKGTGWHGPALNRPGLVHGDSDLSVYRIVRDGIPGTPMVPAPMTQLERWQVVAYVRSLQQASVERREREIRQETASQIEVDAERLRAAGTRTDEWITYSGSLDGRRYSRLAEITPRNVARMRARWVRQLNGDERVIEATPLVVDGVMFVTEPPASVIALNASTGEQVWSFTREVRRDLRLCCGRVNRGLAVFGHSVYLAALDGYLISLDANTGRMIWQTKVAESSEGYTLTGAPLVANGAVVVGVAGGEFAIRGFLAAYDPASGKQLWKFFTVPGPGDTGHETWHNDAWRTGGGPTWNTGSYDSQLDLVYWGVGNPSPVFSGDSRPGENLFTNSVIALHARSGTLAWHFQFNPHDEHDWDATQTPVLAELSIDGRQRKVICWPHRNGFYYVLDRTTGEFLVGTPFVRQDWASGLDARGQPILVAPAQVSTGGRLIHPGVAGATNWQNPAFDEQKGLVFVNAIEGGSVFTKSPVSKRGDSGALLASSGAPVAPVTSVLRALDAATGRLKWEHYAKRGEGAFPTYSGLLATRGGLVFGASAGNLYALDSETGDELWRVFLGGDTYAPPITFTVDGRQVVAICAGRAVFVFNL